MWYREGVLIESNALKITLQFPLYDNEGKAIEEGVWEWWSDEMVKLITDFTDLGVVIGHDRGYTDQNRLIFIVVRSEDEVEKIRIFLRSARNRFRQDTMYLDYHPVCFEEVR